MNIKNETPEISELQDMYLAAVAGGASKPRALETADALDFRDVREVAEYGQQV